ncbi:MAG: stage II sporulation protein D [Clostridia bacterium]|nr:stage II sporulation protein D [Clostridia bacterium]
MKDLLFKLAFLAVVLILIPLIIVLITDISTEKEKNNIIKVYNTSSGSIFELTLEDYLVGVVAAEMPASFHIEAIKAQAVAARTYTLYKKNNKLPEHNGADICTDYTHCQAYCNEKDMLEKWGNQYYDNMNKIKTAVWETKSEYITYDNKPINSVFHSCSDGMTENSSDVWGGSVPYLVSVESPGDSKNNEYITEVVYDSVEFDQIIKSEISSDIDRDINIFDNIKRSSGGNVISCSVYGINLSGIDVRRIFALKSTSFDIEVKEDKIIFKVYGSGHGVGMSQYGANGFANDGYTYKEILCHYYQGTEISIIE